MAAIVKREREDGTESFFVVYWAGGKKRWEKQPSERAAKVRKAKVETELAESAGAWTPPGRLTLGEVAEAWFERRKGTLRPQTVRNYRSVLDCHLLPAFETRKVARIRPSEVEAFLVGLGTAGKGQNTIAAVRQVLRQVLGDLVLDGVLPSNAAAVRARGKRPGKAPRKIVPPTAGEVEKLTAAARPAARPVLELAASTGLRRGELLRLTWADVDLEAREVHVRESKTDAGVRVVPMFGSARRVLLEQKARSRFKRPGDLVFPNAVGTPENLNVWHDREFLHARKQAGLRDTLRLHDLRHFAVSQLIAQGANVLVVARIAGHSRPDVTLRVYAHLFDEGLRQAAVSFDPLRASAAGR
jgi:integrase